MAKAKYSLRLMSVMMLMSIALNGCGGLHSLIRTILKARNLTRFKLPIFTPTFRQLIMTVKHLLYTMIL